MSDGLLAKTESRRGPQVSTCGFSGFFAVSRFVAPLNNKCVTWSA
jgi:hypothetical protein